MVECESTAHMNLSPGHFGECDVTGENGHEESVADDIEDGHVGSGDFGKAEEERGEESHEETGGESDLDLFVSSNSFLFLCQWQFRYMLKFK